MPEKKIEISIENMMEYRDNRLKHNAEWAAFTVAIGIVERLDRIIELLEEDDPTG